ncbi:W [Symbiodinium sp. CCMP2592]|nr:W [Symbiodinium sp. CCMP2592] [Symbiodinium sp. CCMP2592]
MNVAVESLSITVAGGRKLLDEVNCVVQAGDMVALMGPSGAGKTTLLNSIVGRTISGLTEGGIYYDGATLSKVRSSVGYVTQDDIMYETLTPRENLTFAAAFILPKLSKESRQKEVDSVIEKLNLKKCADTVVGSPGLVRGISGGERKRTNVALSLLGSPSLLLLDEPTSGLDSKMSDSLMRDVKQITEQGCTVVATIHQPSEAVFTRFDKVLLLETGRVAYYGAISGLRGSLGGLGFTCPEGTPLPEILLDLLEVPAEEASRAAHTEKLQKLKKLSDTTSLDRGSPTKSEAPPKRAGICGQVAVLFKRELVNVKRNKALTVVRAVQSVASALLIGLIFLQLERNMSSLSPRLFSSFLLVFAQFLFALLGVVNAFPAERAVFLRETQDKLYHPAAFYLAKISIDTLMQCLFPILVVAISYPLIGFNGESADRVLWFYAIMAVVSNCGAGVGFMVSAAVPSVNLALSIAPGLIMPQLLLSGIFIKVEDLPQPFNALSYLMVARYAVQATVVNEFTCEPKSFCDPAVWRQSPADQCGNSPCDFCCTSHEMMASGGICPVLSCDDALVSLGMDEIWPRSDTSTEETIFFNMIALLILMCFFRLQGLNILMCSYRRATTGRCLPCLPFRTAAAVEPRPAGPTSDTE